MYRERIIDKKTVIRTILALSAGALTFVALNQPDSGHGDVSRNGGNPGPQSIETGLGSGFRE